jgi:hypothetical protein
MKGLLLFFIGAFALNAVGQGTVFIYQGALNDGNRRANGIYDFTCSLYDSTNHPENAVGQPVTNNGVAVTNGLFSVPLDFGNVFDGTPLWLEIAVRTNGAGSFVTLDPREPLTPVPYAIFSGTATNLLGPLSAANLAPVTDLIASASNALSAASTTNVASFTNNGLETADDALRLASVPNQQAGIQRTPIRGYLTFYATGYNITEAYASNVMYSTKATGLYGYGYDWMFVDDGWGTTNRDANGNLQWNTNKFPSGAGFVNVVHKMGFKIALYTDGGTADGLTSSGAQAASDLPHMIQDVNQFLAWGVDGGKWDMTAEGLQLGMSVLATNTTRPYYVICGNAFAGLDYMTAQWAMMMNAFRGGGGVGDLISFQRLLAWCDQFATDGFYRWISPGHVYDFDAIAHADSDVEPGTGRGSQAQIVMAAITSAIMLHSFSDVNGSLFPNVLYLLTNSSVLDIQADPAVIAGQRVMQTNNVDVWLKPLGSEAGPQFALGFICRGSTSNVSVTVPFDSTGLNLPAASQQNAGYSVYDCLSNYWVSSAGIPSLTVTLTNHQPALFRLYPGTVITTNYIQPFAYAPTLPAIVISNGIQRVVNVSWDPDATSFIARAQIASDPIQCYAIQFLFTKLKDLGVWTNRLDVLYPMIPGEPYLNAFSTRYTLQPVGPVTTNALGIAGDGNSGYFANGYHFINSAVHYSQNSGSVGIYNGTPQPAGLTIIGGFDGASETALENYQGTFFGAVNDDSGSQIDFSGNAEGLWVASRVDSSSGYFSKRTAILNRTAVSLPVPNTYVLLDGELREGIATFECNAQIRGAWVGGGLTSGEIVALSGIWDEYEAILGRSAQ